eukprot:11407397-Ditylum_brightwellii.AAC.1
MALHLFMLYFVSPLEVVTALLRVWSNTAKEKGSSCATPIHDTCMNESSLEVVVDSLKVCPGVAKEKVFHYNMPLHIAYKYGAASEVVSSLLNA